VKKAIDDIERNRSLVHELIEAFGRLDLSRVCEIVSPHADWWVVGRQSEKRDTVLESFRNLNRGTAIRGEVNILTSIAEGDQVVIEWQGGLEFADGRTYSNEYVWIVTVREAQVIGIRVYNNMDRIRSFFQPAQAT